jgi:predicted HAD superfamily Cof-like phosphohydrolase
MRRKTKTDPCPNCGSTSPRAMLSESSKCSNERACYERYCERRVQQDNERASRVGVRDQCHATRGQRRVKFCLLRAGHTGLHLNGTVEWADHDEHVDLRHNVYEFHRVVIGGELPPSPAVPEEGVARRRMRLIAEEFFETLRAVFNDRPDGEIAGSPASIDETEKMVMEIIANARLDVDLSSLAHELADLEYVCEGGFIGFGIDSRPVHTEIQRANMEKFGGPMRPDGKRLKPPGWRPPDIKTIIESQMSGNYELRKVE